MTLTARRTVISILILFGILWDILDSFPGWFPSGGCLRTLPGLFMLGMAGWLWSKGIRDAGKGWNRALFLCAFAAPIVYFGLTITSAYDGFNAGMKDSINAGLKDGADLAAEAHPERGNAPRLGPVAPSRPTPSMPAAFQLVSWIVLTVAFAKLLDLLERRGAEADRQRELAKAARAEALRGKLAPHFIFNALNTLHAQIATNPKGAEGTTEKLAALFRQALEVSDQRVIALRHELDFTEAYLGIEQARLGDRLRVSIDVPEDLESVDVPPLSLQVLVENAIKHGVAPLEEGGEVRIGAERRDGVLHLWVEDPGTGFSELKGTGTALETLRQRLERPSDLVMGMVDGRHRASFRWRQA